MSKVDRKERLAKRRRRLEAGRPSPSPARNLGVARGAALTVNEIRAYAYAGCRKCRGGGVFGSGTVSTNSFLKGTMHKDVQGPNLRACACATRRFLRAHPEVIVDAAANVFWPAARRADAGLVALPPDSGFPKR